jgi:peptidyl-tRNA hydrolase, PTH1 family
MSKFLVVGLGNIGSEYSGTRHNIGFDIVDSFVQKHASLFHTARLADKSDFRWKGKSIVVIKPNTYMNLSGKAVKYWMDAEKIALENILVILDDLALPLSKIRLKADGSDAGHNGLTSIQESLGTSIYPRLRFGIGNNFPRGGQADYVLGKWGPEEQPLVNLKKEKCVEVIESFVSMGIQRTMNDWNKVQFSV